ncbi:MAG: hypothetical protein ACP5D2_00500 [Candidatus Nanoarchaeia archaeon]
MVKKKKIKKRDLNISVKKGNFVTKFMSKKPKQSDISLLRSLLSKEKARLLYTLKNKQPASIYALARLLERDFKSVREDLLLLQEFELISFKQVKKGKRKSLQPYLIAEKLDISLHI